MSAGLKLVIFLGQWTDCTINLTPQLFQIFQLSFLSFNHECTVKPFLSCSPRSHIAQAWALLHIVHSDSLTTSVNADMGQGVTPITTNYITHFPHHQSSRLCCCSPARYLVMCREVHKSVMMTKIQKYLDDAIFYIMILVGHSECDNDKNTKGISWFWCHISWWVTWLYKCHFWTQLENLVRMVYNITMFLYGRSHDHYFQTQYKNLVRMIYNITMPYMIGHMITQMSFSNSAWKSGQNITPVMGFTLTNKQTPCKLHVDFM